MNLKTTLTLALLVVAGGVCWLVLAGRGSHSAGSETLTVLEEELTPDKLTRIEVGRAGDRVLLEKNGGDWTLPGRWPVRRPEVEQLVATLTGLRSRFAPLPAGESADLKKFGLDQPLVVKVKAGDKEYRLAFAEAPGQGNRFSRPTYLRLNDGEEVVRLAPGLVSALDRPQEYYMQRRLFPAERVAKGGDSPDKVEQLAAAAVHVKGGGAEYTLVRSAPMNRGTTNGNNWELREPFRDRPEPDKLKALLTAVPDIWAETFVDKKGKDLADFGLKEPEQTLRVTLKDGGTITLQVGKQSQTKVRMVQKMAPSPFGGPPQMKPDFVHDEYRFAKLQDNDQVFEIKADRLKDVSVSAEALRDPQVARFRTEDVKKVGLVVGTTEGFELIKEDGRWRLMSRRIGTADAESAKITELLDKLSSLRVEDKGAILYEMEFARAEEEPSVRLTLEESKSTGEGKEFKTRYLTFLLEGHDSEKGKVKVRVKHSPSTVLDERVNLVDDSLLKLVQRPALAYRGRRVLDFASSELAKVEVQRGGEAFTLEQVQDKWRLAAPVQADADRTKADQLARELSRLEVVEFITASPKQEDLDKLYGLAKPELIAKLTFSDKKAPKTVEIGKQRDGKQEYFAKLADDPAVFVVKKETREALDHDSLSYRPLQLWELRPDEIAELRVRRDGPEYSVTKEGAGWKISGPFQAAAAPDQVRPMTQGLAKVNAERYEANTAKDLAKYGLDSPYLRVSLRPAVKKDDKDGKADKADKERVLLLGKQTEKDPKARYARLGDGEAIFVVGEKVIAAADHSALDLLDRHLLTLDSAEVRRVRKSGAEGTYTVQRDKDVWRVADSPSPPFTAEKEAVAGALRAWSDLTAQRFAAYGDKVDLAPYGLDKPAVTLTITQEAPGDKGKPGKAVEHTLALGKVVDKGAGRYARLDNGPAVAVLGPATVAELNRTHLDFVDHTVFKLDPDKVSSLERRLGKDVLELARKNGQWWLTKPADFPADGPTLTTLVDQLAELRAEKVAAYPPKDLASFGLDRPAAVLTVRVGGDGKPAEHVLQIGKQVESKDGKPSEERYARADKSDVIVVLSGRLARQLLAGPLQFRNRDLAKIGPVDKVTLERRLPQGTRKLTLSDKDGLWKMTEPVAAEVERIHLEDFLKGLSRLRADELVADRPADLKPYGLDAPQARWRLLQGDKEVLSLLVGKVDKDKGGRAYAKLTTGDLVFLLDPDLSARALGEYRSRKVWSPAPPDAAQVERLRFGYADSPFVLQKVDGSWRVAGRPDDQVDADAVRDTLQALADLQAEYYVADKGADLKLYGLEPPVLALEVQTASGKHTLHVGRQEGGSGRYYATVPGAAGTPVFVVSEADARRVVRPLQGFLAGKR